MRVRPFFWFLLALSCMSAITLAALYKPHVAGILQVSLKQQELVATKATFLEIRLTDPDGLPIDAARVIPRAHMTNMNMTSDPDDVVAAGHGTYHVHVHLYMAGPWAITIEAHADGFDPFQRTLFVQVT